MTTCSVTLALLPLHLLLINVAATPVLLFDERRSEPGFVDCQWTSNECQSRDTSHPNWSKNCYQGALGIAQSCRVICSDMDSRMCRGYCLEHVNQCSSDALTSPKVEIPAVDTTTTVTSAFYSTPAKASDESVITTTERQVDGPDANGPTTPVTTVSNVNPVTANVSSDLVATTQSGENPAANTGPTTAVTIISSTTKQASDESTPTTAERQISFPKDSPDDGEQPEPGFVDCQWTSHECQSRDANDPNWLNNCYQGAMDTASSCRVICTDISSRMCRGYCAGYVSHCGTTTTIVTPKVEPSSVDTTPTGTSSAVTRSGDESTSAMQADHSERPGPGFMDCQWTSHECQTRDANDPNWSKNCYQGALGARSCGSICSDGISGACRGYCARYVSHCAATTTAVTSKVEPTSLETTPTIHPTTKRSGEESTTTIPADHGERPGPGFVDCQWTSHECQIRDANDPNWSKNCYQGALGARSCGPICSDGISGACRGYCTRYLQFCASTATITSPKVTTSRVTTLEVTTPNVEPPPVDTTPTAAKPVVPTTNRKSNDKPKPRTPTHDPKHPDHQQPHYSNLDAEHREAHKEPSIFIPLIIAASVVVVLAGAGYIGRHKLVDVYGRFCGWLQGEEQTDSAGERPRQHSLRAIAPAYHQSTEQVNLDDDPLVDDTADRDETDELLEIR